MTNIVLQLPPVAAWLGIIFITAFGFFIIGWISGVSHKFEADEREYQRRRQRGLRP